MPKLFLLKAGKYKVRAKNFSAQIPNLRHIQIELDKEVPICFIPLKAYLPKRRWLLIDMRDVTIKDPANWMPEEESAWLSIERSKHQKDEQKCKCKRYKFEHRKTKKCEEYEDGKQLLQTTQEKQASKKEEANKKEREGEEISKSISKELEEQIPKVIPQC